MVFVGGLRARSLRARVVFEALSLRACFLAGSAGARAFKARSRACASVGFVRVVCAVGSLTHSIFVLFTETVNIRGH